MFSENTTEPLQSNPMPMQNDSAPDVNISAEIKQLVNAYLTESGGQGPSDLRKKILAHIEVPLLQAVLEYTKGVETKTAEILGVARNTLRSSLKKYGIDKRDFKRWHRTAFQNMLDERF